MATIDPFSGQEAYAANSLGAQIGIDAAQGIGVDVPLAFRMAEHLPGFGTSAGFSMNRGTNTIMRGGFLETDGRVGKKLAGRRAAKYRVMDPTTGIVGPKRASHFIGGRTERGAIGRRLGLGPRDNFMTRRAAKLMDVAEKPGFVRSARVNNFTGRPRAFGRYHSISVFSSDAYTPFKASQMLGKNAKVAGFFEKRGITVGEGESLLGPGLFSFIGAGRKADILEKKALRKGTISSRMKKKLGRVDRSIRGLAQMNNPSLIDYKVASRGEALRFKWKGSASQYESVKGLSIGEIQAKLSGSPYEKAMARAVGPAPGPVVGGGILSGGEVGVRGNLMASSMSAPGARYFAGYFRGAQGFGILQGAAESDLDFVARGASKGLKSEALKGAEQSIKTFGVGLEKAGLKVGGKVGAEAAEVALREGVFKTLGKEGVFKALGTKAGAKVLGARAAALAIPGLNVVAAAMMAYDLGQMAGEVVKSGINLAKDANKSLKGSIAKPLFGMGYKDTEAAATSRARGVMAIQNSQLNARSALGHEASMMAAHFG